MPDPAWSSSYNFASQPEANGFTRTSVGYSSPATVTATTTGPTAGRKLAVSESAAGQGMVFTTSSVPSLDALTGATAQATVAVAGAGDAGFELRFLGYAVGLNVFADHVELDMSSNATPSVVLATPSNAAATTFRLTVDPSGSLKAYRGTALLGTFQLDATSFPAQAVQFWGESGGTQAFTEMRFYTGGAVAPG